MNSHQVAELQFWRNTFHSYPTEEAYCAARRHNLKEYSAFVPEIYQESGNGLDLACGLVSVFDQFESPANIWAVDELLDEYDRVFCRFKGNSGVHYQREDGENLARFSDGFFDFIWCFNAIDHTPNPILMANEIRRILKPGGRLYFYVNFDLPPLAPAHYALWDQRRVDEHLSDGFHLMRATICWSVTWSKYIYVALYEREAGR